MTATPSTDWSFGFLAFLNQNDTSHVRGGILTADPGGKPLEFRCSSPIRPSHVQRLLYGKSLLPHILVDLVGIPLAKSLQKKPSAILVQDPLLLEMSREIEVPIIHISKQGDGVMLSPEAQSAVSEEGIITCPSGRFPPIVALSSRSQAERVKALMSLMSVFHENTDLLEPFERIKKALVEVDNQKALQG